MRALTVIGVVWTLSAAAVAAGWLAGWLMCRFGRAYELELDADALAIEEAERIVKVAHSKLIHPSNRGNQ